jgi:hypothetical protein
VLFDSIDDAEWKALKQVPARSVIEGRRIGQSNDCGLGRVNFGAECRGRGYAAFRVPARRVFRVLEGVFDVLKFGSRRAAAWMRRRASDHGMSSPRNR